MNYHSESVKKENVSEPQGVADNIADVRLDMLSKAKLFVNGTEIETEYGAYMDVDSGETFIPLTTVLSTLGVDLFWNSRDWAFFNIGDISFHIGTNDKIIKMNDGKHNFIDGCRAESKDNELMICHTDVADMLEYMFYAEVNVDTSKCEIYIDEFDAGTQNCFKTALLLINDEKIDIYGDVLIDVNHGFAVIPFVEVAEYLGATCDWKAPQELVLKYENKNYYFCGMSIDGDDFEQLEAPGGYGKHGYYKTIGKDFLIDTNYIKLFFSKVMHTNVIVDCDSMTVKFTQIRSN